MPTTRSTSPSSRTTGLQADIRWHPGAYLTDGARLLRVVRVDAEGVEVEDAMTEQLEWHPVHQLAGATRAVTPSSVP